MIWPYVIFIYVLTSLLLGLLFHLAACFDNPVRPKRAELVVFFVVFSMLGIPLVMANLLFTSFSRIHRKPWREGFAGQGDIAQLASDANGAP